MLLGAGNLGASGSTGPCHIKEVFFGRSITIRTDPPESWTVQTDRPTDRPLQLSHSIKPSHVLSRWGREQYLAAHMGFEHGEVGLTGEHSKSLQKIFPTCSGFDSA